MAMKELLQALLTRNVPFKAWSNFQIFICLFSLVEGKAILGIELIESTMSKSNVLEQLVCLQDTVT